MVELTESLALLRAEWLGVIRSLGIAVKEQVAPTFTVGRWEFALSRVRDYDGLTYNYGGRDHAWIWQPALVPFMGVPLSARDRAKRWYFHRTLQPSFLEKFLNELNHHGNRIASDFETKVAAAAKLQADAERTICRVAIPSGNAHPGPETALHAQMFQHRTKMVEALGVHLLSPESWPAAFRGRSKPDLYGVDSAGRNVVIEVKLDHLEYGTIEALEYARDLGPASNAAAMYICAAPPPSEVVRARVLSELYGVPVTVVRYSIVNGTVEYLRCA